MNRMFSAFCTFTIAIPLAVITCFLVYPVYQSLSALPEYDVKAWWGPLERKSQQDKSIRSFNVTFGNDLIKDLQFRLRNSRKLAPPLENVGFRYGFNSNSLGSWLQYWNDEYAFYERETRINQFPHFKTNIQGLDIHFVWVKPKVPPDVEVVPLLLLHGWPSSILDFFETIPTLTAVNKDRNFAVEVIAPSLPGFGFSDGAVRPGLGLLETAVVMRNLMRRIGHRKYYIHGGDLGSIIARNLATLFPNEALGMHLTMPSILALSAISWVLLGSVYPPLVVNADVADRIYPLRNLIEFSLEESGYLHIQATKPDTVGIGLSDSPAGLLAYILEKYSTGQNFTNRQLQDGGLNHGISRDQLLDNVMMYWAPNCMTTAMRIYAESFNSRLLSEILDNIPTPVPTWVLQAKYEIFYEPIKLLKLKYTNLLNETILYNGGHFLSLEAPLIFSEDMLKALVAFRDWHRTNS